MSLTPSDISNDNIAFAISIRQIFENNDKNTLQQLLEEFKSASLPLPVTDYRYPPALHLAASESKYTEFLELLLKYSDTELFNIDDKWNGKTALHLACIHGCEENAIKLLEKGCDPYKLVFRARTSALHIAVANGHLNIVEYLLNHHPDNINQSDYEHSQPLHMALRYNYLRIARMLLEKGANVSSVNHNGNSPLHLACRKKIYNIDMISCLVRLHDLTSLNRQNFSGVTPLMLVAANKLGTQGVILLHELGARTDICDNEGRLALHYAAYSGNPELLEYVLEYTETSSIEQWFMNIPNVLHKKHVLHSLIGCAILSRNKSCMKIIATSKKLSKCILQAPHVKAKVHFSVTYSPLAFILNAWNIREERIIPYLRFLWKHELLQTDEFSKVLKPNWPCGSIEFQHPFSRIFNFDWPFSKQLYYFQKLNKAQVTIDYCLQCYHDNQQPFTTFTEYKKYYEPLMVVISQNKLKALKLLVSNSAILEPDEILIQFNAEPNEQSFYHHHTSSRLYVHKTKKRRENLYKYLINLKPIYYRQIQPSNSAAQNYLSWYPYTDIGEEFALTTLQQLCRTTIRHHIRKYTLEENLRDFRRNIRELPIPPVLKDYLLFKC